MAAGVLDLGINATIADSATLTIANGATNSLAAGVNETVDKLFLGSAQAVKGIWGSTASGAPYKDDVHFAGNGKITVLFGPPQTIMQFQ